MPLRDSRERSRPSSFPRDRVAYDVTAEGQRGFEVAPVSAANLKEIAALRLLLEVLGPTRLVVGNDQPPVWFPLAESLDLLDSLGLPPDQRDAIRWGNAARLFGLPVPAAAVASA